MTDEIPREANLSQRGVSRGVADSIKFREAPPQGNTHVAELDSRHAVDIDRRHDTRTHARTTSTRDAVDIDTHERIDTRMRHTHSPSGRHVLNLTHFGAQ